MNEFSIEGFARACKQASLDALVAAIPAARAFVNG